MKLPAPPGIYFHPGPRLMVYTPRGTLSEDLINVVITFLEQEEDEAEAPFNRFTNLSKLDAIDLDVSAMFRISLYRRLAYANYPPVKSAFYVTTASAAELVKVHILLTDHSPIKVGMFTDLGSAARWLDVPLKLLGSIDPSSNGRTS